MLIFFLALTLGFAFELGKNALKIESKQTYAINSTYIKINKIVGTISTNLARNIFPLEKINKW